MLLTEITGILNQIYESIGLPPLVLIFIIALFLFVFIFGLVILIKVRNIRKDLIILNKSLDALHLKIQDKTMRPFVLQKQTVNKTIKQRTNSLHKFSDISDKNRNKGKNSSDNRDEELIENKEEVDYIKNKILHALKIKGRPTSYSEIIKYLSKDFLDYDFDLVLNEIELLKEQGKIIDHYSAGKLYYQIENKSTK